MLRVGLVLIIGWLGVSGRPQWEEPDVNNPEELMVGVKHDIQAEEPKETTPAIEEPEPTVEALDTEGGMKEAIPLPDVMKTWTDKSSRGNHFVLDEQLIRDIQDLQQIDNILQGKTDESTTDVDGDSTGSDEDTDEDESDSEESEKQTSIEQQSKKSSPAEGQEVVLSPLAAAVQVDAAAREVNSMGAGGDISSSASSPLVIGIVAACSVLAVAGAVVAGVFMYRLKKRVNETSDVEYPAYGVTGPNKERVESPGDRKLAQSAQMYHYQHQKQQMIMMERANPEMRQEGSDYDSEDDAEEGDYTVYECPGLAPTGEMEVQNPLFNEESAVHTGSSEEVSTDEEHK